MSEGIKNIEIIERYCEGKMDSVEKVDFEKRLLNEPELNEEYQLFKLIVEGIKEKGAEDLKTRLKIADLELDANNIVELKPKKTNLKYWAIAASLLFIIGLGLFWKISTTNKLAYIADSYYEKDKGLPNEMSEGENQLDKVMQAYKSNNYSEASKQLDLLLNSNNDTVIFYNAIVKYELEDYKNAKENLCRINIESEFFQKAQYRLVLVNLKLNDRPKALKIINEGLENTNHIYFDKLSKLKKELAD